MAKTLAERYDADFLKAAEKRRSKLNKLDSIKFGPRNNKKVDRIGNLLRIIHQNYYFEFYDAVCTLSGIFLEQTLCMVLEEKYRELKGNMVIRRRDELQKIQAREELEEFGMRDLINLAQQYRFLTDDECGLAHELRLIRNKVVHEGSFFMENKKDKAWYQAEIKTFKGEKIIRVSAEEVYAYCAGRRYTEIGAYYVLTRTRGLVSALCAPRVKKSEENQGKN